MPDVPAPPHTVFVSHAHADNEFADALVAALRQAGADVWYDRESLGAGVLLRPKIMRELNDRRIFLVVLSKAACSSQWVKDECEWAYDLWRDEQDTRVFLPVLAGPLNRADFAELLYLKSMRRVEGDNLHPLPQTQAVTETLRLLGLTAAVTADPSLATSASTRGESVEELMKRGTRLRELWKFAEALEVYERALVLSPDNVEAWNAKGLLLGVLGRYAEALAAYEQALVLDSDNAEALDGKGWILRDFKHLAKVQVDNGDSLLDQTQYAEALEAYEKALALDQNNADAWEGKGIALRKLGRTADGDAADQRAWRMRQR